MMKFIGKLRFKFKAIRVCLVASFYFKKAYYKYLQLVASYDGDLSIDRQARSTEFFIFFGDLINDAEKEFKEIVGDEKS